MKPPKPSSSRHDRHDSTDEPTDMTIWRRGPIWMASDRRLARGVARPLAGFLQIEAAGGIILVLATAAALVWANSPWAESYETFWHTEIGIEIGGFTLVETLRHWVNDGLMVLFFFVVAMEIKYELVAGALRSLRSAAVPVVAALGGMVVPALIYLGLNRGGELGGWGIPMATDIAFALGVVMLLGSRVPPSLRVFLLTLAIVDDVGAILVIALFYTSDLSLGWLAAALAATAVIIVLRIQRVWSLTVYITVGAFLWLATLESGVHATIAGVVLGLFTPALPLLQEPEARREARQFTGETPLTPDRLRRTRFLLRESVSVAERFEHILHPWSSYVVLPLFALANAGIALDIESLRAAATSSVTAGVVAGLVVGKTAGIAGFTWLATRLGIGPLPDGAGWRQITGIGAVAGIGFTVALFVSSLAFPADSAAATDAKIGILTASVVAAGVGVAMLYGQGRRSAAARE